MYKNTPKPPNTFHKDLLVLWHWTVDELNKSENPIIAITPGIIKGQATKIRQELNTLRRSLTYWAPENTLTKDINNIYLSIETDPTTNMSVVVAGVRHSLPFPTEVLEGFDKLRNEVNYPEATTDPSIDKDEEVLEPIPEELVKGKKKKRKKVEKEIKKDENELSKESSDYLDSIL